MIRGQEAAPIHQAVDSARRDLGLLTGKRVESVSGVHRRDDGWTVTFEVVELERIPDSTSVMGTYEVAVDGDGCMSEYERVRRYYRNQASEVDD
jgi:hypothetical protein